MDAVENVGGDALREEPLAHHPHFSAAGDEADIVGFDGERRLERGAVAVALCGDDDEAAPFRPLGQIVAFDPHLDVGKGGLLARRRGDGDAEAEARRQLRKRHRDGARPADDELRARQHGLDEDVHRALARAHVLHVADAVALLAGGDAVQVEQILRLHRDEARFAVGEGLARRFQHGGAGATAADPALRNAAVAADHRLGAGLGGGHGDGPHHRGDGKGLASGLQADDRIDVVGGGRHAALLL